MDADYDDDMAMFEFDDLGFEDAVDYESRLSGDVGPLKVSNGSKGHHPKKNKTSKKVASQAVASGMIMSGSGFGSGSGVSPHSGSGVSPPQYSGSGFSQSVSPPVSVGSLRGRTFGNRRGSAGNDVAGGLEREGKYEKVTDEEFRLL